MLLYSIQRKLCQSRGSTFTGFTKHFNRQSKNSKWTLRKNENTNGVPDTVSAYLSYKTLIKPFIFTVSFSGCCFVAATIWQYEEMRKFAQRFTNNPALHIFQGEGYKRTEWRRWLNSWWHSQTQGQKLASVIIGLNLGVFLLWRIPALHPFMMRYFTAVPAIAGSCLPMFLSTFSHYSFFHLAANMIVLYSFSSSAVSFFGKEQFLAFYCSAGVIASFTSYVYKIAAGQMIFSLGASGAIMAILSSLCFQFPDTRLHIVFLPFFTFAAGHTIKALIALDLVGLIAKWKLFDHAAHLGGAIYGLTYLYFGREYIWNKRETIFIWYHNIRERKE